MSESQPAKYVHYFFVLRIAYRDHLVCFLPCLIRLSSFIPVFKLLESLGGSEAYEKDPAAFAEAVRSGWPEDVPQDSK